MNLYIGNLGFHGFELDLRTLFESYDMDSNDATRAMEELQNKEIEGRSIRISIARDKYSANPKKGWESVRL